MFFCFCCFCQSNHRDYRTLFKIAERSDTLFNIYVEVFKKYERGMLKGQTEVEDDKKGVVDVKLYNLRPLGGMTEETCLEVLQLVVDGTISYNEIQKTATVASQLQQTQAALIGVIDPTNQLTWGQMMERFPEHTGREMLLNVFGKVGKGLTSFKF